MPGRDRVATACLHSPAFLACCCSRLQPPLLNSLNRKQPQNQALWRANKRNSRDCQAARRSLPAPPALHAAATSARVSCVLCLWERQQGAGGRTSDARRAVAHAAPPDAAELQTQTESHLEGGHQLDVFLHRRLLALALHQTGLSSFQFVCCLRGATTQRGADPCETSRAEGRRSRPCRRAAAPGGAAVERRRRNARRACMPRQTTALHSRACTEASPCGCAAQQAAKRSPSCAAPRPTFCFSHAPHLAFPARAEAGAGPDRRGRNVGGRQPSHTCPPSPTPAHQPTSPFAAAPHPFPSSGERRRVQAMGPQEEAPRHGRSPSNRRQALLTWSQPAVGPLQCSGPPSGPKAGRQASQQTARSSRDDPRNPSRKHNRPPSDPPLKSSSPGLGVLTSPTLACLNRPYLR